MQVVQQLSIKQHNHSANANSMLELRGGRQSEIFEGFMESQLLLQPMIPWPGD